MLLALFCLRSNLAKSLTRPHNYVAALQVDLSAAPLTLYAEIRSALLTLYPQ